MVVVLLIIIILALFIGPRETVALLTILGAGAAIVLLLYLIVWVGAGLFVTVPDASLYAAIIGGFAAFMYYLHTRRAAAPQPKQRKPKQPGQDWTKP